MRDVSLRTYVGDLLSGKRKRVRPDDGIRSVELVNPTEPGGPWTLRVVVDDGAGGDRMVRVDFTEERT